MLNDRLIILLSEESNRFPLISYAIYSPDAGEDEETGREIMI